MGMGKNGILGLAAVALVAAAAPAAMAESLHAKGMVTEKDAGGGTLVVSGRSYRVTSQTVFEDVDGVRISLADVPVAGGPNTQGQEEPGAVKIQADSTPTGHVLRHLQLIEADPK